MFWETGPRGEETPGGCEKTPVNQFHPSGGRGGGGVGTRRVGTSASGENLWAVRAKK